MIIELEDVCEPEPAKMPTLASQHFDIFDMPCDAKMPGIELPKPNEKDWHECPLALYVRLTTMYELVIKRGVLSIERLSKSDPALSSILSQVIGSSDP